MGRKAEWVHPQELIVSQGHRVLVTMSSRKPTRDPRGILQVGVLHDTQNQAVRVRTELCRS